MEWGQIIIVFGVIATNLMTVIILHLHMDNKTTTFLNAVQEEMKDFHGRLYAIEERNKSN